MYLFLVPLLAGFAFNSTSAFTTFYSRHLGGRAGRLVCVLLRDVLGIPLWALGYFLAARVSASYLFAARLISSILACLLILAGAMIICTGLWSLRGRAALPSVQDTLVTDGLYAHIRHPLYTGMSLELGGLFLLLPTLPVLIACLLGVLWIFFQARLEERDLVQRLPAYTDYMQRVPRFLPRLWHG